MSQKLFLKDKINKELFLLVKKTMEKDGVSQGEVARRIGAARPNINNIMTEKKAVSVDYLLGIAECLGLDLELKLRKK
jgi:plasmid maintenance system antidote protein VapI